MTAAEITDAFNTMSVQLQQVQTELEAEQVTAADLRQSMHRGGDSASSGYQERPDERSLAEDVHQDASVWQLQVVGERHEGRPLLAWQIHQGAHIEYFDSNWTMGQKLSFEPRKCCANRKLGVDVDSALRMVNGAFLEGESKMLTDTAELNNPKNLEMHKSGLNLCRLLKYNFDRASALNVISILESICNTHAAKNVQRVMSKLTALERRRQEDYRGAAASEARIRQHEESRLGEGAS